MAMSKKDFQALARAVYGVATDQDIPPSQVEMYSSKDEVLRRVALALAYKLEQGNPRFNRALFLEACETGKCKGMPR